MTTTVTASQLETPQHAWVPYAAIAAGAGFVLMPALVILTEDKVDGPLVVLYLAAILTALAAAVGAGLRARRGRRTLVAVGLCVAVVAYVMAIGDLLKPVFEAISDKDYVIDNGPIAIIGIVLLGLGARAKR